MAQAFFGNDNLLEIIGLQNAATSAYINSGATVRVTVKDRAGVSVGGATWPLDLTYVAASNGNWRVTLPATVLLLKNQDYVAEISAVVSGGPTAAWSFPFTCIERTG